jgi:hypothetical protein
MAGAMTEIKDEIRSNTIVVMGIRGLFTFLYCVFVLYFYCCFCIRSFLFYMLSTDISYFIFVIK